VFRVSDAEVRLLIDGYNVLHASGAFPTAGPATFEHSRQAFLAWLAARIESRSRPRTIVVFDGMHAAPGLPRRLNHDELTVLFSRRKQSADEVLEELIEAAAYPRQLLVVSSDHRVQRAARQRGAEFVDSEIWAARPPPLADAQESEKPTLPSNPFPPEYLEQLQRERDLQE
jgi:predicted RNA-binding protein with PIN domain